jgi:hypothetical protein
MESLTPKCNRTRRIWAAISLTVGAALLIAGPHYQTLDRVSQNSSTILTRIVRRGVMPSNNVGGSKTVLFVEIPAGASPNSMKGIFKIVDNGASAVRVPVRLGNESNGLIEVLGGLREGDLVIVSDMSALEDFDRIAISNN